MSKKHKGNGRKKPKGVERLIHRIEQVEARLAALEKANTEIQGADPWRESPPRSSVFDRLPDWMDYD